MAIELWPSGSRERRGSCDDGHRRGGSSSDQTIGVLTRTPQPSGRHAVAGQGLEVAVGGAVAVEVGEAGGDAHQRHHVAVVVGHPGGAVVILGAQAGSRDRVGLATCAAGPGDGPAGRSVLAPSTLSV